MKPVTQEQLDQWDRDAAAGNPHGFTKPEVGEEVGTQFAEEEGRVVINRAQDVEPILEFAKQAALEGSGYSPSRELKHVAEFPFVLVEQYISNKRITMQEFMTNPEHIRAMLNDPDLAAFNIEKNTIHKVYR